MVSVALGVSILSFTFMHLSGDPVMLMLPPDATQKQIEEFRERMGFNDPIPLQYLRFLSGAVRGDFGTSLRHQQPAMGLVLERLPADLVVSNADATATRRRLLEPAVPDAAPWRWRRPRQTMSCFLLYLGTTRRFPLNFVVL